MKIFLSSSCYGFEERRKLLLEVISSLGFTPLLSDQPTFPVKRKKFSQDVCLDVIEEADIVVLILQSRYGQTYLGKKDEYKGVSITHAEYRHAVRLNKIIMPFAESEIPKQKNQLKINPNDSSIKISREVFDFYNEVSSNRVIGNWISCFEDTIDCKNQVRNYLNNVKNSISVGNNDLDFRNHFLEIPSILNIQCPLDILSHWKLICDSWDFVLKEWTLTLYNQSSNDLTFKGKLTHPLKYYYDAELISYKFSIISNNSVRNLQNSQVYIKMQAEPNYSKVLILESKEGIILPPKNFLKIEIKFKHSGYFTEITPEIHSNKGSIFFMNYPDLRSLNIKQRVCKEYYISKELTISGDKVLAIYSKPDCDWKKENSKYWILGFARTFDFENDASISILIKE